MGSNGFIDTGIDFTHDDFKNPMEVHESLALWDQTWVFLQILLSPMAMGNIGIVWVLMLVYLLPIMTNGAMAPRLLEQVLEWISSW